MKENMTNANHQQRLAALRLAELQVTDKEDFNSCVNDMVKTASLNKDEAAIVANAIRAKYLPSVAREAGMDEMHVNKMINLDGGAEETADFANDETEDEEIEMHQFEDDEDMDDMDEDIEDDEDDLEDDLNDDEDEVDDVEEMATFEIEVPADMVDVAQKAVQKALDNLLGGEDDMDMDVDLDDEDMEDDSDMDTDLDDMDSDMDSEDDMDIDEDEMELDSEPKMHTSNGVNKMTKQALAARRAEREAILKKIASEEEQYPASAGFKYNEDMVNMPGEVEYPSMTLEGSDGNSLKEQNPSFADQKVPTNIPDSLQFPDITKPSKFEGSGDGSLEYTVDWDSLENPSEGLDAKYFEVPTQMPSMPHKTTVAQAQRHAVKCTTCGYETSMTDAEMHDEKTECSNCAKMEKGSYSEKDAATVTVKQTPGDQVKLMTSSSDLEKARIKAAYSCSSKLALAGIIETSEVDAYADQMLNDNLKADAMIRQTKLLLKSAQASSERVAAAAAERMSNTRTASTLGISTTPAFSGSNVNNAALDIQSALRGTWSMPQIED
jgi:hypothetical protein